MKIALIFFALATMLSAADLTLTDGTVLKNARIISIGEKQVIVAHAAGVATLLVDQVPLEALARAQAEISERENDPARQAAEALARNRAEQNEANQYAQAVKDRIAREQRRIDEARYSFFATIFQVVPGQGFLIQGESAYNRTEYIASETEQVQGTGLDSHKTFTVARPVAKSYRSDAGMPELFFVQRRDTTGLTDGQLVRLSVWRIGEYHYTSTVGAGRTVPRYTSDVQEFLSPPAPAAEKRDPFLAPAPPPTAPRKVKI